jgi:putative DNA primase/helicase
MSGRRKSAPIRVSRTYTSDFNRIPDELKTRPQWVVWRLEPRGGKPTKVLYDPTTDKKASSTDLLTWRPFEEALETLRAGDYAGLGFVFCSGDPYTGVDLDKCRDPETGAIEPWTREIMDHLGGYQEVSPSGTGVHIIVKGKLPEGRNRRGNIEAYSRERFFTISGVEV